jgi:hypothetical protein
MNIHKLWTKKFYNLATRAQCHKTFYGRNLKMLIMILCLSPARLSTLVSCLRVRPEPTGAQLVGRLQALFTNARSGWRGLQIFVNYGHKKFYDLFPRTSAGVHEEDRTVDRDGWRGEGDVGDRAEQG